MAAIVVMIMITAGVVGFIINSNDKDTNPPPVVVNPKPGPTPQPPQPVVKQGDAWWDKMPGAGLTASLAALREMVPQEKALLDGIANSSDIERFKAYETLKDKLPELVRNVKIREPLGRLIADCCVFEPEDRNVSPLRETLTSQLPRDRAEFRPEENGDELKRAVWSLKVAFSAIMNKAIRPDRARMLANQLGSVFGLELNTGAPPDELKKQADELLARRCYRGMLPTASRSLDHALFIRDDLLKEFPEQLPPVQRDKIDVDLVAIGLSKSSASFPKLESILKACLDNSDLTTAFKIVDLYERSNAQLAPKLESVLATKWQKVLANPKLLTKADKVAALRKNLSGTVISSKITPAERMALLQKLSSAALATVKKTPKKDLGFMQDTLKLAHASTMAAAILNKESGLERFDELVARAPEIEQPEPEKTEEKKTDTTDKPEKKPPVKGGAVIGAQPKVYSGQLRPTSARDRQRGGLCDVYSVSLQAGQLYTIDHMSRAFDAYLRLEDPRGFTIAEDDDSGGSLNSRITFQATMNGAHRIIATSLGGGGTGPYTLIISRGAGFGRPARFGKRFPVPLPGVPFPGLPGQMPGEVEPKGKDKEKNESQLSISDLVTLEKNKQRSSRVAALENIASVVGNDIAPRHARRLARYLLSVQGNELDEIAPKIESFAKCRHLILALADQIDKTEGPQKTAEKVVGDMVGQTLQFARDEDWRTACRRMLLQRALDLGAPAATNVAEQTAEILRDLYKEQGYAFGMEDGELAALNRPAQVLGAVIKHVAAKAEKDGVAPEHKESLERIGRYVQAAEFVADSDLEQLVVMQRIWLKVLSIYLQKSAPGYGPAMADIQQQLVTRDRRAASLLDQLRAGEEKALRIWALAHNLKQ